MSGHVLYVSQTGMTEPLGRSQVLPYLVGLSARGWRFHLIAQEPDGTSGGEIAQVRAELQAAGIAYHPMRRRPSSRRGVKAEEVWESVTLGLRLAREHAPAIIHARSDLPAMAAACVAAVAGGRFLYDCRGLVADEYADAGYWRRDSLNYRVLRMMERGLFARADGVVMLTQRARRHVVDELRWVAPERPFAVVPCCVDVERFSSSRDERASARRQLQVGDRFVVAYSGTLGSWYCEEEMARFYAQLRTRRRAMFIAYTRSDARRLREAFRSAAVPDDELLIQPRAPNEMRAALSAADASVSFITPCYSKIASSPTKVGEYLAAGLPVAMNRGVGDADVQLRRTDVFADAGTLRDDELALAATRLLELADRSDIAARTRQAALELFDLNSVGIARYDAAYRVLCGFSAPDMPARTSTGAAG